MKILRGLGFFVTTMIFYLGLPLLGWGYQAIDAPEVIAAQGRLARSHRGGNSMRASKAGMTCISTIRRP